MARNTATIKAGIMSTIAADPLLGTLLTSTSMTSLFGLMAYVMAACQNLLEQSWDDYLVQINTYATQTPAASLNWIAAQAFLYQYDSSGSTNTNALSILPNGALGYPTVDPQFNIVTRCAALTNNNNEVQIKVAQGNPPAKITGTAFTQLQSYFDAKGTAGVNYYVTSGDPDRIYIQGNVYYKSGYGGVAPTNVVNALNNYLTQIAIFSAGSIEPINYGGMIRVSEIIDAIMGAVGVSDFELVALKCRSSTTSFGSANIIYQEGGVNFRHYVMAAGYAIGEDTSGQDWASTLTFQAE